MRIDLSRYLTERYLESTRRQKFEGPVVTIAREMGCPAKKVASSLVEKLTGLKSTKSKKIDWRWISKEILYESARELQVDPAEIKYVFDYEKRTFFDEILTSQSKKYYKSDRQIRKTIAQVVRNIGIEGNVIIVGRGGVALTKDIAKSFHVMLEAPLEWRALRVSEKYCMNVEEAKKFALDVDAKRKQFREYFHGRESDYTVFDVKFNCMTLSVEDITESIIRMMQLRDLV